MHSFELFFSCVILHPFKQQAMFFDLNFIYGTKDIRKNSKIKLNFLFFFEENSILNVKFKRINANDLRAILSHFTF